MRARSASSPLPRLCKTRPKRTGNANDLPPGPERTGLFRAVDFGTGKGTPLRDFRAGFGYPGEGCRNRSYFSWGYSLHLDLRHEGGLRMAALNEKPVRLLMPDMVK